MLGLVPGVYRYTLTIIVLDVGAVGAHRIGGRVVGRVLIDVVMTWWPLPITLHASASTVRPCELGLVSDPKKLILRAVPAIYLDARISFVLKRN